MQKFLPLLVFLMSVATAMPANQIKQPMIATSAPPFKLSSLTGEQLALSDLRGKVVVLHFGAGW